MPSSLVTVVTGDIVKSRKYLGHDRVKLQKHLLTSWKTVEKKFASKLQSELGFHVTGGDEFQFVCKDLNTALDCITLLRIELRKLALKPPIAFRASIAVGSQTIKNSKNPYTQDGPVFHLARKGMDELKKSRLQLTKIARNQEHEPLSDALLSLTDLIHSGWTAAQAKVLALAEEQLTGEQIAKRLKLTPATVSEHLSLSRYEIFKNGISETVKLFERKAASVKSAKNQ